MRAPLVLLATATTVAAVPGLCTPAWAHDELGLSRDGVHWHDSLRAPLFDPAVRWVPGDVRTEQFYVREQAETAGDLTVTLERSGRAALLDSSYLSIAARAGTGTWTTVHSPGVHQLVDTTDVAPGTVVPVDVRVAFAPSAPNGTMLLASDLDFQVTLTEADAVLDANGQRGGPGRPGGSTGGWLAATGATFGWWLPVLGLLLLGAGAYLARRPHTVDVPTEAPTDPREESS